MPVTGIPIAIPSYGVGTATTNMLKIGILLNIAGQRTKYILISFHGIDCERGLS